MKLDLKLVLIILLAASVLYLAQRNRKLSRESDNKSSIIAEKTDSLHYERNARGQEIASKNAAVASLQELQEAYGNELEQIREQLNIKDRDLRAFMQANFQAKGSGTTIIHNHYDSTGSQVVKPAFSIEDGYLALSGAIQDSTLTYQYTYTDQILAVFHYEKKGLFKKELHWSGSLSNPNARITSATNAIVDEYKDRRWNLSVGVSYSPFTQQVLPTVSVGWALIKL